MRIGQDVSIQECRRSGYAVIDYSKRKLFPNNGPMDKDCYVKLTISNPHFWGDSGYPIPGSKNTELFVMDNSFCWNDAWERYLEHKESIDSFADVKNCPFNEENPSGYDLLRLLDTVHSYCGLE